MKKHLVLVGGGHAHMVTLSNIHKFIEKGCDVSVIGPSPHHYYSGMGPGMLGKLYEPDDIRFATKHVVEKQGGLFILGKAVRVNPDARTVYLESGRAVQYDVLSFNAGSYVSWSNVVCNDGDIFSVKPIEKLLDARNRILSLLSQKKVAIGIVGGGPAAVEIAGNIHRLAKNHGRHMPEIRIFAGNRFMPRFDEKIRKIAANSLTKRGIEILEHGYAGKIETGRITMESGLSHDLDVIFLALGVKPSTIFKDSGLPIGPDGGLLVNEYLQSTGHPEILGGGDCIYFKDQPLDKVGVYAVRQNPVLYHNLMALMVGGELMPFDPGGDYLLIFNMGDGSGILRKKRLVFGGRIAFAIKDYIDRKFIKKFQSIE